MTTTAASAMMGGDNNNMVAAAAGPDPAVMDALGRGHAVVFLDVGVSGHALGRIKLELFTRDCPRTCENFRQFCTGEYLDPANDQPIGYKNATFHRVLKNFMIQGGDFLRGDGTGQTSIYGTANFADENFLHSHREPGMLSSANAGPNTNGCQFFITTGPADFLDGKHCVFGKVLDAASMLTVRKIENVPVSGHTPKLKIEIVECGEL